MKQKYVVALQNGSKTSIVIENKRNIYVPITEGWLNNNLNLEEMKIILKKMKIDPDQFAGKNTHKKLREIIIKQQN